MFLVHSLHVLMFEGNPQKGFLSGIEITPGGEVISCVSWAQFHYRKNKWNAVTKLEHMRLNFPVWSTTAHVRM